MDTRKYQFRPAIAPDPEIIPGSKRCSACRQVKNVVAFPSNGKPRRPGPHHCCKACHRIRMAELRETPEAQEREKTRRQDPEIRERIAADKARLQSTPKYRDKRKEYRHSMMGRLRNHCHYFRSKIQRGAYRTPWGLARATRSLETLEREIAKIVARRDEEKIA